MAESFAGTWTGLIASARKNYLHAFKLIWFFSSKASSLVFSVVMSSSVKLHADQSDFSILVYLLSWSLYLQYCTQTILSAGITLTNCKSNCIMVCLFFFFSFFFLSNFYVSWKHQIEKLKHPRVSWGILQITVSGKLNEM